MQFKYDQLKSDLCLTFRDILRKNRFTLPISSTNGEGNSAEYIQLEKNNQHEPTGVVGTVVVVGETKVVVDVNLVVGVGTVVPGVETVDVPGGDVVPLVDGGVLPVTTVPVVSVVEGTVVDVVVSGDVVTAKPKWHIQLISPRTDSENAAQHNI